MCPDCGRPYGKRKRCYHCKPAQTRRGVYRECAACGSTFYVPQWAQNDSERRAGMYCSRECKYDALRGRSNTKLAKPVGSRRVQSGGYIGIKCTDGKYRLEHRVVAESMIGRPLATGEHVHHINGDKTDNRPENLEVLTNSEHQHLHEHWKLTASPPRTCEWCGGEYRRKPSRGGRFCSHPCYRAAMKARKA